MITTYEFLKAQKFSIRKGKDVFRAKGELQHIPGDPKKSIPLFGVLGETQVFAKQLNRHIFG